MANDIHFSWSSLTTVSPKEVRERQVLECLVGSIVLIYFHTCHSLCMLLSTSNFPSQMLLQLTYSEFNSTPNANRTVFMNSSISSTHCLCSNPYNLSLTLHHWWFSSNCTPTWSLRERTRRWFSWQFQLLDPDFVMWVSLGETAILYFYGTSFQI